MTKVLSSPALSLPSVTCFSNGVQPGPHYREQGYEEKEEDADLAGTKPEDDDDGAGGKGEVEGEEERRGNRALEAPTQHFALRLLVPLAGHLLLGKGAHLCAGMPIPKAKKGITVQGMLSQSDDEHTETCYQ